MVAICLLSFQTLRGQNDNVADRSAEVTGRPENTSLERPVADYQPSAPGFISLADAEILQNAGIQAAASLAQAPDDATGKQSVWYPLLQSWATAAVQTAQIKSHEAVFALIPTMASYFASWKNGSVNLAPQFLSVRHCMESCGSMILRTIGADITLLNGTVSEVKLNSYVRVHAAGYFCQEGEWEGKNPPINAAGVMILNAAAVVTQLKAGPWKQASQFLEGETTASEYFDRYIPTGDGLTVLKTKYAANQDAIDAKFVELKTWVDQQKQESAEGG
jgi:hypothetical protein